METILFLAHTEGDGSLSKAALEVLGAAVALSRELPGANLAAGLVTGLDGGRDVIRHGSIVAGNPAIHAWLMTLLNSPSLTPSP